MPMPRSAAAWSRRAARLLTFVLLVAQLAQLPANTPPARAAAPVQTVPAIPTAPVESTSAPQPTLPPTSASAVAAIPAHLDEPALQTELLIIGNPSVFAGQEGLWRYVHPHGWVRQVFPTANWVWFGIAASPHNPDHWLLWGHPNGGGIAFNGSQLVGRRSDGTLSSFSPLWRSPDAGRTWLNVGLSAPPSTWTAAPHLQVAWSPTEPGAFTVMGYLTGRGGIYSDHFSITKDRYALWYARRVLSPHSCCAFLAWMRRCATAASPLP